MHTCADVGGLVLGLATAESGEPDAVLGRLVDAVGTRLGLTTGAAVLADGAVRGIAGVGPPRPREVLAAGFGQGPGGECARTGRPVLSTDLDRERPRWLAFVAKASAAGIGAAWALPVRHAEETVGALLLLGGRASEPDLDVAAVLAGAAAAGILRARERDRAEQEAGQLRTALTSRITVEQAKGMLAVHAGTDITTAFESLRSYARRNGRPLAEVASAVVHGELPATEVLVPR
ncbi:GAF and ANTAR domain-containing protein [Pseudonocardia phyllosphaerae]|uniref:GAF and ANTAR domain-containing protein n=1 Tax=Pseudonocardia phyllosphaerae TaxID=3390502 RepID=UPI00397CE88A